MARLNQRTWSDAVEIARKGAASSHEKINTLFFTRYPAISGRAQYSTAISIVVKWHVCAESLQRVASESSHVVQAATQ